MTNNYRITSVRNMYFSTPDRQQITCEAYFEPIKQWHEMEVSPNSDDPKRRVLFVDICAGVYGKVAEFTVTPEMLEQEKLKKYSEINQWRQDREQENIIFTINGKNFDCSKISLERLEPVVSLAKSGSLPDDFFWTDADNNNIKVTADDLINIQAGMIKAIVDQGFKIHARQRQMKENIDAMTDFEQIKNYIPAWNDPDPVTETPAASEPTEADTTASDPQPPEANP